ncbi:hypothetical protein THER_1807 [Thermodesulfovibrio sp. N1]|nr:hypothetical protein THER_1807 [Thermodesulfovibrio sp. N1]
MKFYFYRSKRSLGYSPNKDDSNVFTYTAGKPLRKKKIGNFRIKIFS